MVFMSGTITTNVIDDRYAIAVPYGIPDEDLTAPSRTEHFEPESHPSPSAAESKDGADVTDDTQEVNKPKLPNYWLEMRDPLSGRPYYFNVQEDITTWERPISLGATKKDEPPAESDERARETLEAVEVNHEGSPTGWVELDDSPSSDSYQYNEPGIRQAVERKRQALEKKLAAIWERPLLAGEKEAPSKPSEGVRASNGTKDNNGQELTTDWIELDRPLSGAAHSEISDAHGTKREDDRNLAAMLEQSLLEEDGLGHSSLADDAQALRAEDVLDQSFLADEAFDEYFLAHYEATNLVPENSASSQESIDELEEEHDQVLPAGWKKLVDPSSGNSYYYKDAEGTSDLGKQTDQGDEF